MRISFDKVLELMKKKYGGFRVLIIYDDGSGAILKSELRGTYEEDNRLFEFGCTEELVEHLKEKK